MIKKTTTLIFLIFNLLHTSAQIDWSPTKQISNQTIDPQCVYASDFDNDGDLDVVSASGGDDKIAYYKNDGSGNFGAQQVISSGVDWPVCVYACDIDGDGDDDILSASWFGNTITWYGNDGTGNFGTEQVICATADYANSVYACDLDGDKDLDVLSASTYGNGIAWYENTDGKGSFGSEQIIADTNVSEPMDAYACDIDGDGDMDVLSASTMDHKIAWYKNDGKGNFGPQQIIDNSFQQAWSVFACDMDGDNDNDVIAASYGDNTVAWYENIDDAGTFSARKTLSSNFASVKHVTACDMDGDGDMDVLASAEFDNVGWFKNNGNGSFASVDKINNTIRGATYVEGFDMDGDGYMDALTSVYLEDQIVWFKNRTLYFDSHPKDTSINCNDNAAFLVYAPHATRYQWQENSGSGFKSIYDLGIYSGTETQTLKITNAISAMDGFQYRCLAYHRYGPIASDTATLYIIDTINPTITSSHHEQFAYANITCNAPLPDFTGTVTATDNCDINLDVTQSPVAGTDIIGNSNEVTLTVTDDGGNTDQVSFNVVVIDTISPIISSIPNDTTILTDYCSIVLADYTSEISAFDNCDTELTITQSPVAGTFISGLTNTIILRATDQADNWKELSFNIQVKDTIKPTISSILNDTVVFNLDTCEIELPDYTDGVVASDSCSAILVINQNPAPGSLISDSANTITISVSDEVGNSDTIRFNVQVLDTVKPVMLSTHEDVTIENDDCEVVLADYTGDVFAKDNCSSVLNITQIPPAGTSISGGVNEVTLIVGDEAFNITTVKFNLIITDTIKPVITSALNNQTLAANNNCEAILPDYTIDVKATDNCDTAFTIMQSPLAGTIISDSLNTVVLTVADHAGNSSSQSFNVQVIDTTKPVISSIHDEIVIKMDTCEIKLADYTGDVLATDNCSSVLNITQEPPAGTILTGLTNKISITVSDEMNNSQVIVFNVQAKDTVKPVITSIHNDVVLSNKTCNVTLPDYTVDVVATDNCTSVLEVMQTPPAGTTITGSRNQITLTVSDSCQNKSIVTFNVLITDTIKPVFASTISNQILLPEGNCEVLLPDFTHLATVTDNCDTSFVITQQPIVGTVISDSLNTVTLSASDIAGNSDKTSFNVQVTDTLKPSIRCVDDQSVYLTNGSMEYTISGSSLDASTAGHSCSKDKVMNDYNQLSSLEGAKLPLGTTTITWTITTEYGKSSSCSCDIEVNDPLSMSSYMSTNKILYPNPTNGKVYVKMNSNSIQFIRIYGLLGNLVGEEHQVINNEFDISALNNGVYLVEIITNQERLLTKITKH